MSLKKFTSLALYLFSSLGFSPLLAQNLVTPTADSLVQNAKKDYLEHHFSEAIGLYQQALEIDPQNAQTYGLMGYSYYRNNQLDEARKALEKSIGLDPNLIMSHYNLALVDWALAEKRKFNFIYALDEIGVVIKLDPKSQKIMLDDPQFQKIFESDVYRQWATQQQERKAQNIVGSNPEIMKFGYENLLDGDGTTSEIVNDASEQKKVNMSSRWSFLQGPLVRLTITLLLMRANQPFGNLIFKPESWKR